MIRELEPGGFSLEISKTGQKEDATHPLKSPVGNLDGSCRVVVLLGKSDRSGTVWFLSLLLLLLLII